MSASLVGNCMGQAVYTRSNRRSDRLQKDGGRVRDDSFCKLFLWAYI